MRPKSKEEEVNGGTNNDLLTPASFALSLAAPRAPPHYSIHRDYLIGKKCPSDHPHRRRKSSASFFSSTEKNTPHPHLSSSLHLSDKITRTIGLYLPVSWQNKMRDDGTFRSIADNMATSSIPMIALTNPSAAKRFLDLENSLTRIPYGTHRMQTIHLYQNPTTFQKPARTDNLVFFVHGGAWGSGLPWMYRLVAGPFLDAGMSVAIVGYRTYPDANAEQQVDDLERAACELIRRVRMGTVSLVGHSSGAHVALSLLVRCIGKRGTECRPGGDRSDAMTFLHKITSFVGLSGPYSISHHFDYEAARGVEEISPMKPCCGFSRHEFRKHSPASSLADLLVDSSEEHFVLTLPSRILLVHGMEDDVVPFTSTADAARSIRGCGGADVTCEELYFGKTGHQGTIMDFMLGGPICEKVMEWLKPSSFQEDGGGIAMRLECRSGL